ncbi:MAG: DUF2161 family putative PD-(D/E)XK-type phosphodiesterase [Lachnospiraceae bacterium]
MEKDLFEPIKSYFESFGYVCDGEVADMDLYMEKEGNQVCVELKLSLDFKAVRQAALRQKVCDTVFIGIPRPGNLRSSAFREKLYLLRRLGIGLILVSPRTAAVEIASEPVVQELSVYQQHNGRKRQAIATEFQKRKIKNNTGGVTRTRLMTGYREDALLVADALFSLGGEASPASIRKLCGVEKTTNILYHNYYGWFAQVKRGVYRLTEQGQDALKEYANILNSLKT